MKCTLLSISAILTAVSLLAAPRSIDEAQGVAKRFMTSDANRLMKMSASNSTLQLAYTAQHNEQPAFYVFNNGSGNGFVVVSADDNARDILGYSDNGTFDYNDMPENMRVWFQHYEEEIAWAAAHPRYAKLSGVKKAYTPVAPLLGNITWDQGKPYNNDCPIDQTDKTRAYTGCVATAAAQIMRYWKHPQTGTGSHTDNWDNSGDYSGNTGKGKGSESANFGETTYDWDNMLESYSGSSYTTAQAKAVSTLMYHVGISCDMIYGGDKVGGSGAFTSDMAKALYTYFKYDKGLRYIMRDNIGGTQFEKLFLAELAAGRPILMGGATKNNEGHEFVCDGVNAEGYFHINWGWGGMSNNYFALSALDPEKQGAGGAASGNGFSVQVEAIIGIQPDKGNPLGAPSVDIEPDSYGNYDYKFNKTAARKSETILFQTEQAYNNGPADVTDGKMVFAVYNTDSTLYNTFGNRSFNMPALTSDYQSISMSSSFNGLPAGDYLLAIAFRMDDSQDWTPIAIYGKGEYLSLYATADSIYISEKPAVKPGGDDSQGGNLDVDIAWATYDASERTAPWTLVLTNESTYAPWIQCQFKSGSANKIAGTYNVANMLAMWADYYSEDYIVAVSGTLKLICLSPETDEDYATYSVELNFVGEDNNTYSVSGTFEISAQDTNRTSIELKDEAEAQAVEQIAGTQKEKVIKVLRNGTLILETENAVFNINGAKIQ